MRGLWDLTLTPVPSLLIRGSFQTHPELEAATLGEERVSEWDVGFTAGGDGISSARGASAD
jgi:hypothetical protein